jgi:hypothetical protein
MIVMEALNSIIREADRREALSPLAGQVIHHRASLYADDLVMFLAPVPEDLTCLRRILDAFAGASGLITNLEKCVISPIHCSDTMISEVQQIFTCQVAANIWESHCRCVGCGTVMSRHWLTLLRRRSQPGNPEC